MIAKSVIQKIKGKEEIFKCIQEVQAIFIIARFVYFTKIPSIYPIHPCPIFSD